MAKPRVTKTVRLPASIAEALEVAAKITGNSENQIVLTALADHVGERPLYDKIREEIERTKGQ